MIRRLYYKFRAFLKAPLWLLRRYILAILAFVLVLGGYFYLVAG
jgi:hypothetical protein